jgi:hypothetical protein
MMRIVQIVVILVVIGAGYVYFKYGTVEPCGVLREQLRRQATAQGGSLGGLLASVTPDSVINAMIQTQHDNRPVTPALCVQILLGTEHPVRLGQ